jgi:hypothetical protein
MLRCVLRPRQLVASFILERVAAAVSARADMTFCAAHVCF